MRGSVPTTISPRWRARLGIVDGLVRSQRPLVAKAKGTATSLLTFGKMAVEGSSGAIHFVGRRFWRSFHCAIPLSDMTITQSRV